jgi:hypothetical protein
MNIAAEEEVRNAKAGFRSNNQAALAWADASAAGDNDHELVVLTTLPT